MRLDNMNKEEIKRIDKLTTSTGIYDSYDQGLIDYQHGLVDKLYKFNATPETEEGLALRDNLLREMLGTYGENIFILPPIYANFGLRHVHVGKDVFINFNCVLVDDSNIYIGDDVMIGPSVKIVTANHPISPKLRKRKYQCNKPVHIGNNVWIGAGAIILPGVTLGDNSIVGAGAVVTKSFEENSIIVGNPARLLRKITPEDDLCNDKKPIPEDILNKLK